MTTVISQNLHHRLIKVENAQIYTLFVSDIDDDIFIDSLSFEIKMMTTLYPYFPGDDDTISSLSKQFDKFNRNFTKHLTADFLKHTPAIGQYYNLQKIQKESLPIKIIDQPLFYFSWNVYNNFAHSLVYGYSKFYYFFKLKKEYPNLKILFTNDPISNIHSNNPNNNVFIKYIINLFNLQDDIIINDNSCILYNKNDTFFAGLLRSRFDSDIINNFYYDLIVKNTLKKSLPEKQYPKKILMLRNNSNNLSLRILKNRQDIVELASKYGYVDIDQTLLTLDQTIHLVNCATHIIMESGGSILHLLWSKPNTRIIILTYDHEFYNQLGKQDINYIGNNQFGDIADHKNATIIYNNDNLKNWKKILPSNRYTPTTFVQMDELTTKIIENE